jgi:hypothetical protein
MVSSVKAAMSLEGTQAPELEMVGACDAYPYGFIART